MYNEKADNVNQKKIKPTPKGTVIKILPTENGYEMEIILKRQPLNSEGTISENIGAVKTGDMSVKLDKETLLQLIDEKKLDEVVGQGLIQMINAHEAIVTLGKKTTNNKEVKTLLEKQQIELSSSFTALHNCAAIKKVIEDSLYADKMNHLFNKNVDQKKCVGITKALMERLIYLTGLLNKSALIPQEGGTFKVQSTLSREAENGVGTIGLEHTLQYSENLNSLEKTFKKYLKDMKENALKVFLAYWAYANEKKSFCYQATITEIMSTASKTERTSYFSTKEKARFWAASQLLESTYLTFSFKHKGKWLKIKHPLLCLETTESNEKDQEEKKGYPNKVVARVLNPDDYKSAANLATEISKGTLKLAPKDIMLAITLETRASQRREANSSTYDENYLLKLAGLEKHKKTNHRMAKKRLQKKLNRIQKHEGIQSWQEENNRYKVEKRKKP